MYVQTYYSFIYFYILFIFWYSLLIHSSSLSSPQTLATQSTAVQYQYLAEPIAITKFDLGSLLQLGGDIEQSIQTLVSHPSSLIPHPSSLILHPLHPSLPSHPSCLSLLSTYSLTNATAFMMLYRCCNQSQLH